MEYSEKNLQLECYGMCKMLYRFMKHNIRFVSSKINNNRCKRHALSCRYNISYNYLTFKGPFWSYRNAWNLFFDTVSTNEAIDKLDKPDSIFKRIHEGALLHRKWNIVDLF